jgi:predicted nucleotide-binding protein (sugar kinase/HSP70/actin superfamily)
VKNKPQSELVVSCKRLASSTRWESAINYLVTFVHMLTSPYYVEALKHVRHKFDEIEVDRFRVKPVVKITGEFWAQTTEGDGNFNMFRFLEEEGAEVLVEPLGTWILYLLHQYRQMLRDRKGIDNGEGAPPRWRITRWFASSFQYAIRQGTMALGERIFKREYSRLRNALGGTLHELADQYELQQLANSYYSSRAEGGEGHLEVAENIYYHGRDLCHMVLSVKPFGCMPSTQSDGAQAAVVEHYRDMIFLPIETSGEGETSALSRVQMALGSARAKAKEEFRMVLASTDKRLEDLAAFVDDHPALKRPTYRVPHHPGIVGRAANFVAHVAGLMEDRRG